jgi:hypothetical protein
VLDSLTVFEERASAAAGTIGLSEDPEVVRSHAYELSFSSEDEMFHSTLYDWLIHRQLADDLLEVRWMVFVYIHTQFALRCDQPSSRPIYDVNLARSRNINCSGSSM